MGSKLPEGIKNNSPVQEQPISEPGKLETIAFVEKEILSGSSREGQSFFTLLGLFLAHEPLENLLAIVCFLGKIAHFLKFSSTAHSAESNHLRLLLLLGGKVLSVVFQKASRGIFWDFRHLNGAFNYPDGTLAPAINTSKISKNRELKN